MWFVVDNESEDRTLNHEHKWTCKIIIDRKKFALDFNVNQERVVDNYGIWLRKNPVSTEVVAMQNIRNNI